MEAEFRFGLQDLTRYYIGDHICRDGMGVKIPQVRPVDGNYDGEAYVVCPPQKICDGSNAQWLLRLQHELQREIPLRLVPLESFPITRFPVTCQQYLEFETSDHPSCASWHYDFWRHAQSDWFQACLG